MGAGRGIYVVKYAPGGDLAVDGIGNLYISGGSISKWDTPRLCLVLSLFRQRLAMPTGQ
jgi:hypothetical protein